MERKHFSKLKRVMQESILKRRGYHKGKEGLHYRQLPHGTSGIELQISNFRDVFFVNVMWTFADLPGFFAAKLIPPDQMILADFAFYGRLESVSQHKGLPASWSFFKESESEVESMLQSALALAAEAGDSVADHFSDTRRLIEALPPDLVLQDNRNRLARVGHGTGIVPPERIQIGSALHGFYPGVFQLAYTLFYLSRVKGKPVLAQEYLEIARATAEVPQDRILVQRATNAKQ